MHNWETKITRTVRPGFWHHYRFTKGGGDFDYEADGGNGGYHMSGFGFPTGLGQGPVFSAPYR